MIKYCADMTNCLFFGEKVGVNTFYFVHLSCAYADVVFNHEIGKGWVPSMRIILTCSAFLHVSSAPDEKDDVVMNIPLVALCSTNAPMNFCRSGFCTACVVYLLACMYMVSRPSFVFLYYAVYAVVVAVLGHLRGILEAAAVAHVYQQAYDKLLEKLRTLPFHLVEQFLG